MMVELVLIDEETDEVFTTVEIPQELFDKLVEASEKSKKTVEEIIKEAITEGIEKEKKAKKKK